MHTLNSFSFLGSTQGPSRGKRQDAGPDFWLFERASALHDILQPTALAFHREAQVRRKRTRKH